MSLHAVILAGGRGERFWPLSRRARPKQLLPLISDVSLLEGTLERIALRVPRERRWIAAAEDLKPTLVEMPLELPPDQILWETVGRNTAPALGAAAECVLAKGGGTMLVLPSDHWIPDAEAFWAAVDVGETLIDAGSERVVTFGIEVAYAETGYGYVERGAPLGSSGRAFVVSHFHEKPDLERAQRYAARPGFYWNSGIFVFDAAGVASLLRRHVPSMEAPLERLRHELRQGSVRWSDYYEACPAISIDYAVAEQADDVAVVEARFPWSDLGAWPAWGEQQIPDANGNRARGNVLNLDSEDCLLYSEGEGLLATLGVKDLIVVRVGDATLVCAKDRAQEIRRLVEEGKLDAKLRPFF